MPHNDRVRMQRLASWGFSIPAAGNHKEHVWKLLEYLVSAEVAASIYRKLGWLGGLHRDMPLHIAVTENPILLWYIESLDKADRIYGVKAGCPGVRLPEGRASRLSALVPRNTCPSPAGVRRCR